MSKSPIRPLVLLLAAAVLLVAPSASAADLRAALKYVPRDAVGAVTVDVDDLRKSKLYKQMVPALLSGAPQAGKKLEEMKKHTGFDLRRDVHGLVFAVGKDFPDDDDDFVLIAEARVNEAKMVAFMKKEGADIKPAKAPSGRYYQLGHKGDGALAFRGKHVIVAGQDAFHEAMKQRGPSPKLRARLARHMKRHVGFALGLTPAMRKELGRELPQLGKARHVSGSLHVARGLDLSIAAGFSTAKPPRELARRINRQLGEARKSRELQRMKLASILDGISVRARGRDLRMSVKVGKSELEQVLKTLERLL